MILSFLQMKHFQKFLTPYLTKFKLTLNPEGDQGALLILAKASSESISALNACQKGCQRRISPSKGGSVIFGLLVALAGSWHDELLWWWWLSRFNSSKIRICSFNCTSQNVDMILVRDTKCRHGLFLRNKIK